MDRPNGLPANYQSHTYHEAGQSHPPRTVYLGSRGDTDSMTSTLSIAVPRAPAMLPLSLHNSGSTSGTHASSASAPPPASSSSWMQYRTPQELRSQMTNVPTSGLCLPPMHVLWPNAGCLKAEAKVLMENRSWLGGQCRPNDRCEDRHPALGHSTQGHAGWGPRAGIRH